MTLVSNFPRNTVPVQKLRVVQLIKQFQTYYGTTRLVTMFTTAKNSPYSEAGYSVPRPSFNTYFKFWQFSIDGHIKYQTVSFHRSLQMAKSFTRHCQFLQFFIDGSIITQSTRNVGIGIGTQMSTQFRGDFKSVVPQKGQFYPPYYIDVTQLTGRQTIQAVHV